MNEVFGIFVERLLTKQKVTMFGAVVLSRDVECFQDVCLLGGSISSAYTDTITTAKFKFDLLREIIVIYMVPPESLKQVIIGDDNSDDGKNSLFKRIDKSKLINFLQRRADWKTSYGRISHYASELNFQIQNDFMTEREAKIEEDRYVGACLRARLFP